MECKNNWERIFDDLLDLLGFKLIKYEANDFGVLDMTTTNLGNIESERFDNAPYIIDRLDMYEYDYIVSDLIEAIRNYINKEVCINQWNELLQYRDKMPIYYGCEFDYIELICNYFKDVNLENCTYITK